MQNETILLLANPMGNKKRIDDIVAEISRVLLQREILFALYTTSWPQQINAYKEIWLVGGDGTVNFFLNAYKEILIPIVLFKGGTGNDFATKLYGTITVAGQIEKVLQAEITSVDAAECNGRKFINGVGIGFDGEVLKSMGAIRWLGGHLGYLWIVIKKVFSFKEGDYQIQIDNDNISGKYLLVMLTNSTTTGGGFIVSPAAKLDDGKLNMVLCKPLPIIKRVKYLPVIEKGKHLQKDFIIHEETEKVTIECEQETLAQIDGELISAKDFVIKVLPAKYLFRY